MPCPTGDDRACLASSGKHASGSQLSQCPSDSAYRNTELLSQRDFCWQDGPRRPCAPFNSFRNAFRNCPVNRHVGNGFAGNLIAPWLHVADENRQSGILFFFVDVKAAVAFIHI